MVIACRKISVKGRAFPCKNWQDWARSRMCPRNLRHQNAKLAGCPRFTTMDARPTLISVARSLREQGLESILIGNAAAALWGAPLTTLDLDFLFRKTPGNLKKLKAVARSLSAVILKPYYPVSDLFRVVRDDDSLQLDFMAVIHGIRSYNALRSRVTKIDLGGEQILVAALSDIIASKRAANRARDRAVLDVLQKTLEEQEVAARRKIEGSQNRK